MVTLSRNTQGGLGHRLRGQRGVKSAAPTPAEQQWRRQPERNGAARVKGERRELGGERIRPRHTAEQQNEKGKDEAEKATTVKKGNASAARRAKECGKAVPGTPVFIASRRGLVTSQPASQPRERGGAWL